MVRPTLPPCLLWDVDGTLIDTTTLIVRALDHIYTKYYHRTLDVYALHGLIGTPLRAQIRVFGEPESFGVSEETITEEFISYYELHRSEERILTEVIAILVEGKRQGIPTALVTSKNHEELANTLPRLGIADVIDLAVTADDVAQPKPAPEGVLKALAAFGIPPERHSDAYYIGDTIHDMQAANSGGVKSVGVLWGAATRSQLEAVSADFICSTPNELLQILFFPHNE